MEIGGMGGRHGKTVMAKPLMRQKGKVVKFTNYLLIPFLKT
jgi:hypothetical protein